MAVFNEMLKELGSLTDEELEILLSRLNIEKSGREKDKEEKGFQVDNNSIISCPHCGSISVVKTGKKDGKQRYKCKDCKKYFIQASKTLFNNTRLTKSQWIELLRGLAMNLSLTKIANNIGTSTKTVWYNKNKVLTILQEMFSDQDRFIDIAECDEYSVHMSFKGKKDPRFFIYTLGRLPRHHRNYEEKVEYLKKAGIWDELQSDQVKLEMLLNGDSYLKGTNKDSVCILTGKDRAGNIFAKPVCLGSLESSHVVKHFDNRFEPDAILVTDGSNCYDWFADERNIHHEKIVSTKHAEGPYNLARVNSLHSNLSTYWSEHKENLPATKYLDLGIMLFWWLEKNKDLTPQQAAEELYSYLESKLEEDFSCDKLRHRKLSLDTKGLIPDEV